MAAAEDRTRGRSVLVVYASRFGSTREVAERIAGRLAAGGHDVRLRAAGDADGVEGHAAVVFGSAVFNQRWLPEGDAFVRGELDALAARPVWLFSVGTFGDSRRVIGPLMRREPKGIGELTARIGPRDYRVFAGVIDRRQWPFLSRLFFHALGGRLGDNRDWPAIEAWADAIARALAAPA